MFTDPQVGLAQPTSSASSSTFLFETACTHAQTASCVALPAGSCTLSLVRGRLKSGVFHSLTMLAFQHPSTSPSGAPRGATVQRAQEYAGLSPMQQAGDAKETGGCIKIPLLAVATYTSPPVSDVFCGETVTRPTSVSPKPSLAKDHRPCASSALCPRICTYTCPFSVVRRNTITEHAPLPCLL